MTTQRHSEAQPKNPRKVQHNDWILHFAFAPFRMTIPAQALALILTFGTISGSLAETCNVAGRNVTCIEKLTDGNGKNSCGTNCLYKVVEQNGTQVLHVYKENISQPASIREGAFSPKYYANEEVLDAKGKALPVQNIVLDNDFESIGSYAFAYSDAQISSASGKFVFDKIGAYITFAPDKKVTLNGDILFNQNSNGVLELSTVKGDVIFSDNITEVGWYAIGNANIDGNVIIPASIKK